MNSPEEVVRFYLERLDKVPHPVEKAIIKSDLMMYHYRLPVEEAQSVEHLLQPLLDEIELEMIEKDPLLKRVHETLARIRNRQQVSA
jgi:hypothetical protein